FILKRLNDPDLESDGRQRLYRKRQTKLISGIIAGFADQFHIDVSIVRLIVVIFCILEPYILIIFSLIYLAATFILPYEEDLSTLDS
ncbi:MAG: PspC domain-containing protein, partial [Calditrichaeota bacterium]|nr:PspC domain-containing protein [Calditrichota bacterium]